MVQSQSAKNKAAYGAEKFGRPKGDKVLESSEARWVANLKPDNFYR